MVRGAVGVRRVERVLGILLERDVVVEDVRLVGVDVPDGRAGHVREQRRVREGVIEVAELPVEDVRVGKLALVGRDQVDVARLAQGVDRVLLVVGVQVADDEGGIAARAGRVAREPVGERRRGERAGEVAVALAVARVRVADLIARRALGLEVVHRDGEALPVRLEGLRERRAVPVVAKARIDARVEHGEAADRRHARGAVDHADADRVGADDAGVDVVVDARADDGVDPGDEIGHGHDACGVLELDQADDVRVETDERGDELRPLALELDALVRAAAFERELRSAVVRAVVEAQEVVQHVQARDGDVAADRLGRGRTLVDGLVAAVERRLDAVAAEGLVDDAGDAGDDVAAAETVPEGELLAVAGVYGGVRVLRRAGVVDDDAATLVLRGERVRRGTGLDDGGRRVETIPTLRRETHHDLAEAVEVEVLADDERLHERHEHALERLEIVGGGEREHDLGRLGNHRRAAGLHARRAGELGLRAAARPVFGDGAGDAHELPGHDGGLGVDVDEDPFGRRGIEILVPRLLLDVEAAEPGVHGRDHALHRLLSAEGGIERLAGALDGVDRDRRVAALTAPGVAPRVVADAGVRGTGRVERLAGLGRAREAGNAGEVEVVAHPVVGRVGVGAVRNP